MSSKGVNKLDSIRSRAGSSKRVIYLPPRTSDKRFDYMDKLQAHLQVEIKGNLSRRDPNKTYLAESVKCTNDFRKVKLKEFPSSKRILDYSLQPESKLLPGSNRNKIDRKDSSECNMNESSFSIGYSNINTARTINSILNRVGCEKKNSGRKQCKLVYKSFTLDNMGAVEDEAPLTTRRTSKNYLIKQPPNKESKEEFKYHPHKKIIVEKNQSVWKNGYWDLKEANGTNVPFVGNGKNFKNVASSKNLLGNYPNYTSGLNHTNSNVTNSTISNKEKYVPANLRKSKLNYGRCNYTQTLQIGLVGSSIKAKTSVQNVGEYNKKKV